MSTFLFMHSHSEERIGSNSTFSILHKDTWASLPHRLVEPMIGRPTFLTYSTSWTTATLRFSPGKGWGFQSDLRIQAAEMSRSSVIFPQWKKAVGSADADQDASRVRYSMLDGRAKPGHAGEIISLCWLWNTSLFPVKRRWSLHSCA